MSCDAHHIDIFIAANISYSCDILDGVPHL